MKKQPIKIKPKKWYRYWWYLIPSYRKWLKLCNKQMNKPEIIQQIRDETEKRTKNVLLYGTSHPKFSKTELYRESPLKETIKASQDFTNLVQNVYFPFIF